MPALLGQRIEEMEQRALGHRRGLIEDAGAIALDQGRRRGLLEIPGRRRRALGACLEHMGDMGLAATGGAVDGEAGAGPVRPAVEPGDRGLVAGGDQEILAPIGGAVA